VFIPTDHKKALPRGVLGAERNGIRALHKQHAVKTYAVKQTRQATHQK